MQPHDAILVVEDEPDAITLLRHAFTQAGITQPIQTVPDGEQAMAYLDGVGRYADRATYPLPALILLDLKIPRRPGLEVLAWIRAHPSVRLIPVIVLTSSKESSDLRRAYAAGANAFLVKPSSLTRLVELAGAVRDFWIVHNEIAPH